MKISRQNRELDEPIAALDLHLRIHRGDFALAWANLDKTGQDFVQGEISHCRRSVRYYLQNYHVINNTKTRELSAVYPLWDSQELILEKVTASLREDRPLRLLILKARQQGSSSSTQGITFHEVVFRRNCDALVVSFSPPHAEYLFGMSKMAYLNLPWWMQPEVQYEAKQYLVFNNRDPHADYFTKGLNSSIRVDSATREFGFAGTGRTPKICHLSELSLWPEPTVLTRGLFPALHGKVLVIAESTANGYKNFMYTFWKDCRSGDTEMEWETLFIPDYAVNYHFVKLDKGEHFDLETDETEIQTQAKETYDIEVPKGYFKWRRASMRETVATEGSDEGFYEQHPVTPDEAFQSTGDCPFPKGILRRALVSTCEEPLYVGEIDLAADLKTPKLAVEKWTPKNPQNSERTGTRLAVWEPPLGGRRYFVAADVSEGVERDFSCCQIFKLTEGQDPDEQVAEWHGWMNPVRFAWVIAALGYWYNGADVAPEANDVGRVVIGELYRGLLYPHWYIWKQPDKRRNVLTNFLGWKTQYNNVGMLNQSLSYALKENAVILRSADLVREMLHFTDESGTGRYAGAEGEDDRVSAARIGVYCSHDSETRAGRGRTERPSGAVQGIPGAKQNWPMVVTETGPDGKPVRKIVTGIPLPSDYGEDARQRFVRELLLFDTERGPGSREKRDEDSFDQWVTSDVGFRED